MMPSTRMADRIVTYLRNHPGGVTAREVALECLHLSASDDGLERIARAILSRTPGVSLDADGLFRIENAEAPEFALEVLATGPHPPVDSLLAIGAAPIAPEREAPAALDIMIRPDPMLSEEAIRAAGAVPLAIREGIRLRDGLVAAARTLAGTRVLSFATPRPLEILRRALRAEGLATDFTGAPPVRPALRAAGIVPARGGLADAALALGVPMPDEPTIGERAAALAAVVRAARNRGVDLSPPASPPAFDFGRTRFGPETLHDLPERPGVYRFLGEDGDVLYVGKAADLNRRVRDYFRPGADRRKKHGELMARVRDLTWVETGSEIEALFREMTEIREHAPPYNIQREVRRRRPVDGDLVLFLPGVREEEVEILFVRGGRPAGRAAADRRGRGMRAVRAALFGIYRDGSPEASSPEDAEILASWLRKERDRANHLDLSETAGFGDAARRIKAWLIDPDLFSEKTFRR